MQINVSNEELMVKLCAIEGAMKEFWKFIIKNDFTIANKEEQCEAINKYFASLLDWEHKECKRISK